MAARAEIALARRAYAVLADPIAVVDEVARRRRVLGGEIDVAGIARPQVPLVLVLVAAQAKSHFREQRLGPRIGDRAMAADAVSMNDGVVLAVVEAHVPSRELGAFAHRRLAVASEARAFVVGLSVTAAAIGVGGEMRGTGLVRMLDARVALHAVDTLVDMSAVLERMGRIGRTKPEHARARGEEQRSKDREGEPRSHRNSSARETRARAFTS